jgi:hypothetical protein
MTIQLTILLAFLSVSAFGQKLPLYWEKSSAQRNQNLYTFFVDKTTSFTGKSSGQFKSTDSTLLTSQASFNQQILADNYRGKTVEFSIVTKILKVDTAGFWLRIDGDYNGKHCILEYEPSEQIILTGDSDWKKYSFKANITDNASYIKFGMWIVGRGTIWVDNAEFKIIGEHTNKIKDAKFEWDKDVEIRMKAYNDKREKLLKPENLDFEIEK